MDSLSLKNWVNSKTGLVPWSDLTRRWLPQVLPPSLEVTVATPVSLFPLIVLLVASRPTAYAVPSGPMETQGSEARPYGAPVNGSRMALGAHTLKGRVVSPQVVPPLTEKPATSPCAPPLFQRSCCQTPIRLTFAVPTVAGLTATNGSTSALTNTVPGSPALTQLA